MPSPFPGMDPFIEGQRWPDFHTSYVTVLREQIMPRVRPRYVVEVQEYVYLTREGGHPIDSSSRWTISRLSFVAKCCPRPPCMAGCSVN